MIMYIGDIRTINFIGISIVTKQNLVCHCVGLNKFMYYSPLSESIILVPKWKD